MTRSAGRKASASAYPPATCDRAAPRRTHLILVECLDTEDALLRVLGLTAVLQARLVSVSFEAQGGKARARLEIDGLSPHRAEHLCRRLRQLPMVSETALGWRASANARAA